MRYILPLILVIAFSGSVRGQMPQCHMLYWDDQTYIYNYDPSLPVSATNPVRNTIVPPPGYGGLTVCAPLDGSSSAPVFYIVIQTGFDSGHYAYYNGTRWINTGHHASALNIGAGGGYIYNLKGQLREVYRYNGVSERLISDSAVTGDYDVAADCEGNWYLLGSASGSVTLKKFDPAGSLVRSWPCILPRNSNMLFGPSAGLAIIGSTLLFDNPVMGGMGRGIIGDSTVVIDTATIRNPLIRIQADFASCAADVRIAPLIAISTPQLRLCRGSAATFTSTSDKGSGSATYRWMVNGTGTGGNTPTFTYAPADGDTVTCLLTSSDRCGNVYSSRSNAIVMTVDTPYLVPSVTITSPGNAFCAGQPSTFTANPVNGGTPAYQWMKNGFPVGASSATYTDNTLATGDAISVSMTGNIPCGIPGTVTSNVLTVTVTRSIVPGININTVPPATLCAGTPITFVTNQVGGGARPQYQWFRNGSPIFGATGATYTDAGLADHDTLTVGLYSSAACPVTQPTISNKVSVRVFPVVVPEVFLSASPGTTVLAGQPVTFTASVLHGGNAPVFYWLVNGSVMATTSVPVWTTASLREGDVVKVRMDSHEPCPFPASAYSGNLVMHYSSGVAGSSAAQAVCTVYPNPVKDVLNIDLPAPSRGATFRLSDNYGRPVLGPVVLADSHNMADIRHLAAGVYFYTITVGDAQYRGKLLKLQ